MNTELLKTAVEHVRVRPLSGDAAALHDNGIYCSNFTTAICC